MKIFDKILVTALITASTVGLVGQNIAFAASTPSLGASATYGVLSSTYTNTVSGTTINGGVGFTTGPAVAPAGVHTNYGSGAPYSTAGTDQASALNNLNNQVCTFNFAPGAIDFATDTTHGPIGIYTPGVYCTSGAASIGTGGITLNGSGTYIFRVSGALTTVANSVVTLANGASACNVFWTPTQATTLGANSTFAGIDIDNSGVTVGNNVTWSGSALAFGGTVTTVADTITTPTCSTPYTPTPNPSTANLRIIKQVVNNNGGTASPSLFNLHVKLYGSDVVGSPALGTATPGSSYTLSAGTYVVSEDTNNSYARSFSGDCDSNGNVTLSAGDNKTCTITNDDIAPIALPATLHIVKQVVNNNGGTAIPQFFNLHVKSSGIDVSGSPALGVVTPGTSYTLSAGTYVVSEDVNNSYARSFSGDCDSNGNVTLSASDNKTCTITNDDIAPIVVPSLPNTGISPEVNNVPWNIIISVGIFAVLSVLYLARKKQLI